MLREHRRVINNLSFFINAFWIFMAWMFFYLAVGALGTSLRPFPDYFDVLEAVS